MFVRTHTTLQRAVLALAILAGGPAPLPAAVMDQSPARQHLVTDGPVASQELVDALAARDRQLFALVFERCDDAALTAMLADDFAFFHDKAGQVAASPGEFVKNVREGCAARAAGTNVTARRELVAGTMAVYPMQQLGAIQVGRHRFFGVTPGQPDQLRETAQFFHVWKQVNGQWKLSRVYSYDHRAAH